MENSHYWILAQADTAKEAAPAAAPVAPAGEESGQTQTATKQPDGSEDTQQQARKPNLFDSGFLWVILAMFAVIYFVMMRPQKKKQQQHRDMLSNLKKNDRVRTIGGIIGTVVDVRDDEIVLKVDESNNTKMHFLRSAVGTVLADQDKENK